MSPCHPDRVRRNVTAPTYSDQNPQLVESTVVDTHVIKTMERDVRMILEFMDQQYTNDDLRQAMKRLRNWVGR